MNSKMNLTSKCIFVLAVLTLTLEYSEMTLARKNIFQRDATLDDVLFTDNAVFDVIVRSSLDCVSTCSQTTGCFLVTLYDDRKCRGHNVAMSNAAARTPTPGARTYTAEEWLEAPCTLLTDCATINEHVACFEGLCLCVPGYYYSVSTRQCLPGCAEADLQNAFVMYPNHTLHDNNHGTAYGLTLPACLETCLAYTSAVCRTAEYHQEELRCNSNTATVLDVAAHFWQPDPRHYFQRKCA